jgi:hypothetical protein
MLKMPVLEHGRGFRVFVTMQSLCVVELGITVVFCILCVDLILISNPQVIEDSYIIQRQTYQFFGTKNQ